LQTRYHLNEKRIVRHPIALLAIAALTGAVLTGCAASAESSCTYDTRPGDALSSVTVDGAFGAKPAVTFATPLKASTNQYEILSSGSGAVSQSGDSVTIDVALYDGATGDQVSASNFDGSNLGLLPLSSEAQPVLSAALTCVPEGSRVLTVLGDDAKLTAALNLPEKSTIVAVFDVHDVNLGKANGSSEVVPDGFPMIVLAADGTPGITFMSGAQPPTETKIAVLKSGNGMTVTAESSVTVAYSGWLWPTEGQSEPTQFDSTWAKNKTPATFSMAGGVIAGFSKALVGQKVGSQVEVIIAPADGYGATGQGAIPGNATLVFVIDILGVH